eukprot:augustus_masked-scaffold_1-processed-gene-13.43-mRNA-1 protein AED:0.42 eAED:0.43 QI:0/-1/0/1/-1/1/1/0/622
MYKWVLKLQSVDMIVYHISSRDNFVSDLLTRWGKQEKTISQVSRCHFIQDDDLSSISSLSTLDNIQDSIPEDEAQILQEDFNQVEDFENYLQGCSFNFARVRRLYSIDAVSYSVRMDDFNPEVLRPTTYSINEELSPSMDELLQKHISFLSPFYSGNKDYKLQDRKIIQHQKKLPATFVEEKCNNKEGLLYFNDKLVIPRSLAAEVIIFNHIHRCHPSFSSEKKYLEKLYFHGIPKGDFKLLLKSYRERCLHCNRTPKIIRRPYNFTQLAKRSRDILRADYLYINSHGYILVLLDSCTRKVLLTHEESPTAEGMVRALMRWRTNLGFAESFLIITDNGSHFANRLLKLMSKAVGFEQSFTIAYSPWTNGPVETINTIILQYIKTLTSQFGIHDSEWPTLLEIISYIINNSPNPRRLDKTPNELFLYYKLSVPIIQKPPQLFATHYDGNLIQPLNVEEVVHTSNHIRDELDKIQDQVSNNVKLQRDRENSRRNRNRGPMLQFSAGDYVLISEHGTLNATEKTRLNWMGPYQVLESISENVYIVESLLGKRRTVHGARMWFYSDAQPPNRKQMKKLFVHNFSSLEVENIISLRVTQGRRPRYELEVKWLGFSSTDNTFQNQLIL